MLLAASLLALSLSACSDDDGSTTVETKTAPAVDNDVKQVTDLYEQFWAVRIQSENSATIDASTYEGILAGVDVEEMGRRIDGYRAQNLKRVGAPVISDIEVTITGDTAKILACQNEDEWRAEIDGKLIPAPEVLGNVGAGATAEKRDGAWILTKLGGGQNDRCA